MRDICSRESYQAMSNMLMGEHNPKQALIVKNFLKVLENMAMEPNECKDCHWHDRTNVLFDPCASCRRTAGKPTKWRKKEKITEERPVFTVGECTHCKRTTMYIKTDIDGVKMLECQSCRLMKVEKEERP